MSATHIHTFGSPASPGTITTPDPDELRRMRDERIMTARAEKAKALARVFRRNEVSAATAARLSDDGWVVAAKLADVKLTTQRGRKPFVSHPTRSAVVALLSLLADLDELAQGNGG